jgi:hypothetical protein
VKGTISRGKKLFASLFASALLFAGLAAPASAQPVVTGGLVNVTIVDLIDGDVLSNNNVAVGAALAVAANVCDVNVNVLAIQLRGGGATCENNVDDVGVVIRQVQ